MTDSVTRLKQLLFDRETATLADIARRLDDLASAEQRARAELAEAERRARAELAASSQRQVADAAAQAAQASSRIEQIASASASARTLQEEMAARLSALDQRIGSDDALRRAVAAILDDIIVEARDLKQDDVSRALAPMLVKTIKAELKNNQAEMVEALYPITGQLVKAYVASAMKDLTRRMNRRIQSNAFMLRMRSLFSGYSVHELALAENEQIEVEELYLVRRGSGELLERWPATPLRSNSDIHMSGVMSAINDFATDAFQTDGGQLRSFNLDEFTVYLRASPVYLLAAKCRGSAVPGIESLIDEEFLAAVDRYHRLESAPDQGKEPVARTAIVSTLHDRLQSGISRTYEEVQRAGMPFNPVRALVATCLLALVGGLGWYGWQLWSEETTRREARATIAATGSMRGFPVLLDVGRGGSSIAISGLAPSDRARQELFDRLKASLPNVHVEDRGLAPLPPAGIDVRPDLAAVRRDVDGVGSNLSNVSTSLTEVRKQVAVVEATVADEMLRRAVARSLDQARGRLDDAGPDLAALLTRTTEPRRQEIAAARSEAGKAAAVVRDVQTRLASAWPAVADRPPTASALDEAAQTLRTATGRISGAKPGAPSPDAKRGTGNIEVAAEELALAAERFATTSAAAAQAAALTIPPPPTALDRLQAYVRMHAIFFATNDDYRDAKAAQAVVAEVARLAREARASIRVVGYTDERGAQTRNTPLAQSRADKVLEALVAAGMPRNAVRAVGRSSGPDISPSAGPDSANRRVEFEIGFVGEPGYGAR